MSALPVHVSVVVVVEREGRYLMTLEERGLPGGPVWYFPAGALEAGETLGDAARREVLEETGYTVEPLRIIRIDHGVFPELPALFWWRYTITARPLDAEPQGSLEADVREVAWVALDDLPGLRLRAGDALQLALRSAAGDGLDVGAALLAPDGRLEGFIA